MKNVLFIVNSLGGGGAERVCVNLANKMADSACNVKIITVFDRNDKTPYRLDKKIEIYNLGYNLNNKFEKLKCLLFAYQKINRYIKGLDLDWALITDRLPMSNMITRVSAKKQFMFYIAQFALFPKTNRTFLRLDLDGFLRVEKFVVFRMGFEKNVLKSMVFQRKIPLRFIIH